MNRDPNDTDISFAASTYDDRDWHGYECAHGHRWWSAPTSNRCPACGTTTYKPLAVHHGELTVLVPVKDAGIDVEGHDEFGI